MPPRERTSPLPEQVLTRQQECHQDLQEDPPVRIFLPTGCTLLNCALSDRWDGGWPGGRISNPVGDSDTGKTLLMLSCLAEACNIEAFDDYKLIFADCEASLALPGLERMFGKKFTSRVEILSPSNEDSSKQPPETVEEWHYQVMDLIDDGKPFVYVLDSLDHLPSKDELSKTEEQREAHKKGKDTTGTYGMSKQKYLKKMFREISCELMKTESFLFPVSQTIANIGSMFTPKSRAGGSGLDFSSRIIAWLNVMETDKINKIAVGRKVRAKISKNHITYKKREVLFWVYDHLGVDDTKSNIEFLVKEQIWPRHGGWIIPEGISEDKFQMKELIKYIERNNMEKHLAQLVGQTWTNIEASLVPDRKKKYL